MDPAWTRSSSNASSAAPRRVARRDLFKHFESPECPECGYLGWTPVLEVTEAERRAPRERARVERRLPSVA